MKIEPGDVDALVDRMVTWQPARSDPVDSSNPYFQPVVEAGRSAVPRLLGALDQNDAAAKMWAVRALGAIGDPTAFEPLLREYRSRPDNWAAISVCACLDASNLSALFAAFDGEGQKLRELLRPAYGPLWKQVQQKSDEELRADLLGRLDDIRRQCRRWSVPMVG